MLNLCWKMGKVRPESISISVMIFGRPSHASVEVSGSTKGGHPVEGNFVVLLGECVTVSCLSPREISLGERLEGRERPAYQQAKQDYVWKHALKIM